MVKATFAVLTFVVTLAACSGGADNPAKNEHVMSTQQKTLENAKATEQLIGEAVLQQKREISEQTQ